MGDIVDHGTRRGILQRLKSDGPQKAAALAEGFGISAMAVRQHLHALETEGLVSHRSAPGGVGRPAKVWTLTPAADSFFPQGYADLTNGLLDAMMDAFGQAGLDQVIAARTDRQVAEYRTRVDAADPLPARVAALAHIRTSEGYMARAEAAGEAMLLFENHCPICAIASRCRGLCRAEMRLFQSVLGDDVRIERVEHIVAGGNRCTYRITQTPR